MRIDHRERLKQRTFHIHFPIAIHRYVRMYVVASQKSVNRECKGDPVQSACKVTLRGIEEETYAAKIAENFDGEIRRFVQGQCGVSR